MGGLCAPKGTKLVERHGNHPHGCIYRCHLIHGDFIFVAQVSIDYRRIPLTMKVDCTCKMECPLGYSNSLRPRSALDLAIAAFIGSHTILVLSSVFFVNTAFLASNQMRPFKHFNMCKHVTDLLLEQCRSSLTRHSIPIRLGPSRYTMRGISSSTSRASYGEKIPTVVIHAQRMTLSWSEGVHTSLSVALQFGLSSDVAATTFSCSTTAGVHIVSIPKHINA
jgi:hypothetical protein